MANKIEIDRILTFVPAIETWWRQAKVSAVGQDLLISNIALFIRKLSANGVALDRQFFLQWIGEFSPSDIKDSSEMTTIFIQLI
jgi:hypothetical protein